MTAEETLGKRIRYAEMQKIPYMLVVGDEEKKGKSVNVRNLHTKEQKSLKVDSFMKRILEEIKERRLN